MFTVPIALVLGLFIGYSEGDPALISQKIAAWQAAHPYQVTKAPDVPIVRLTKEQEESIAVVQGM